MKKYSFIWFLAFNISCAQTNEEGLELPKLILSEYDSLVSPHFEKMQSATVKVYGIGVVDSLKLTEAKWALGSQYFPLRKKEDFVFFVDISDNKFHSHFMYDSSTIPPPPPRESRNEDEFNRKSDSILARHKIYLEAKERVHHESYPFFIYNRSRGKISVSNPISDPDLFILMEALNKNGEWRPIEFWEQYSFLCGTGHQDYQLEPKTFLIGAVKKYSGSYKTKLRLKLSTTGSILYSNEFDGEINYSQFDTTHLMDDLKSRFFYGDNSRLESKIKAAFLNN